MERMQHPSNNAVLGAPKGWDQGELPVGALPITRVVDGSITHVVSFWRPNAEELAALAAGAPVMLFVVGHTMPPVALAVEGV
ncbi:hypothetical protein BLA13014_04102 [Burkholderia aenigmatica]|uniref:Uncharacterized protein n=1 Tax=Burkholderia aenigmatica TaxID=2015348 RepID=A0A6P2MRV2_9BURK|nr:MULTISPECIES: hypothetical protein [Burkholderia]VWB88611.1 hypothetical protein BLA13014_04102 [Burkholderia aenigmatica]